MSMTRRAFTLIELLVVIAIIAILAAILFPVFAAAKESAKATAVLSYMKQIGTSILMYGADYDDMCIAWVRRTGIPRDTRRSDIATWVQELQPYIKNGKPETTPPGAPNYEGPPQGMFNNQLWNLAKYDIAFAEPDCNADTRAAYGLDPLHWAHAYYGIGIGIKGAGCISADPAYHFAGSNHTISVPLMMSLTEPVRIAESAIVGDGYTGTAGALAAGGYPMFTSIGCESQDMYKGGGNFTYVDGHSKFVKGDSQRYHLVDGAGCVYMKFFDIDR